MNIEGSGVTSDILRGIGTAFEPFTLNNTVAIGECIPNPYSPDYRIYYIIAFLCILAWIFSLFEPYGLRIRHVIMRYYYPHVTRKRATWLYNKIIVERSKFLLNFIIYLLNITYFFFLFFQIY